MEPLPLSFVVAENVHRVALAQPAMQLREKFAALRLGNLRLRRAFAQRTKRVEGGKQKCRGLRVARCGLLCIGADCVLVDRFEDLTPWI